MTPAVLISASFVGQAVAGEPDAVCAEGVGFKNLSAGLQVLFVDGKDETGIGEIQLVVAAVDEDAAGVEHGTHGAIGEQGAVSEDLGELGHSVDMLSHGSQPRQSKFTCATDRRRADSQGNSSHLRVREARGQRLDGGRAGTPACRNDGDRPTVKMPGRVACFVILRES